MLTLLGLPAWVVCEKWTDYERECLKTVSKYLPSLRKMVKVLGMSALADYSRHGNLSDDKVKGLEAVEGLSPDADNDNDNEDGEDSDNSDEAEETDGDESD